MLFTILFYKRYASKSISIVPAICIIVVWFISFSNAVLVPYDIYLSYEKLHIKDEKTGLENKNDQYEHLMISNIINLFYVVMQIMSLLIIPMLLEYEMAGEFSFREKLCTAIKRNLLLYAAGALVFLLFIAYMVVKKQLTG
jgi:hypothetical protein